MSKEVLGVDIGGVIIDRSRGKSDTSFFDENYLQTPAVPGAFETLRQLVEKRFANGIYLVSKAGPKTQIKTMEWMEHNRFFEITGIDPQNVRFCLERPEKAAICQELGVSHFIDDNLEVLTHLDTVSNMFLFRPRETDTAKLAAIVRQIMVVQSWPQLQDHLLPQ